MPSDQFLISLQDVVLRYGLAEVLRGITLHVTAGEVVAIIGPSGGGKSSILRVISGLAPVSEGTVHVGDVAVHQRSTVDNARLRRMLGMVFQSYNLFPHMTALRNVTLGLTEVLRVGRDEANALAVKTLDRVGLANKADAYPDQLSGGQQQRVAIARCLALNPRVMLFDEVTAALDPETVREVLAAISELAADGLTLVLVTHEMRFAREVADRVVFVDDGKIVEEAPPDRLFDAPSSERTQRFLSMVL